MAFQSGITRTVKLKKLLIPLLKFAFAGVLIWWIISTGKISAAPFIKLWASGWLLPFVLVSLLTANLLGTFRWFLILKAQRLSKSFGNTVALSFIGLFFNFAVPGSIGGDFVKAYYLVRANEKQKLLAVSTILIDRLSGLYGLILLGLASIFWTWPLATSSKICSFLSIFLVLVSIAFTLFWALSFSETVKRRWATRFLAKIPFGKFIDHIYTTVHSYRHHKRVVFKTFVLSVACHIVSITALYVTAYNLNYSGITLGAFFFVFTLGSIANALPVSPGGVGMGQAVFLALFTLTQGASTDMGPTLATIMQVGQGLLSLVGAVIYFFGLGGIKANHAGANQK